MSRTNESFKALIGFRARSPKTRTEHEFHVSLRQALEPRNPAAFAQAPPRGERSLSQTGSTVQCPMAKTRNLSTMQPPTESEVKKDADGKPRPARLWTSSLQRTRLTARHIRHLRARGSVSFGACAVFLGFRGHGETWHCLVEKKAKGSKRPAKPGGQQCG